jgi:hypothetical protein
MTNDLHRLRVLVAQSQIKVVPAYRSILMTRQMALFSSQALKLAGLRKVAENNREYVAFARERARWIARARGEVCSDDIWRDCPPPPWVHVNVMGGDLPRPGARLSAVPAIAARQCPWPDHPRVRGERGSDMTGRRQNLWLWEQVCRTDPAHTREVTLGRKFTSIDAMYQVQRCTEIFGAVGDGWGYDPAFTTLEAMVKGEKVVLVFCDLGLWWRDPGEDPVAGRERIHRFGPIRGCNLLVTAKGTVDEDAPKKALTDALTKALSHLGFSADVFLGMYDDNRYVERMRAEFGAAVGDKPGGLPESVKVLIAAIRDVGSNAGLDAHFRTNKPLIDKLSAAHRELVLLKYREQRRAVTSAAAAGVADVAGHDDHRQAAE